MKKERSITRKYVQIRLKESSAFKRSDILAAYGVDCDFLESDDDSPVLIGFNVKNHEKLVNAFINSGWDLISVSEDEKSISFHFIKEYYE